MIRQFKKAFNEKPTHQVSSYGRFEILGNHTDHNGGLCLAAACNLGISGVLSKRNDMLVKVISVGYGTIEVNLSDLNPNENEHATSEGLIRGVAAFLNTNGYKIGGFNLFMKSTIFKGAGVSSSAAYEVMVGQIFNNLYNENKISEIEIAKAGQYAENNFFGKNSGLLDQSAIAFSNISFLNFRNQKSPSVESIIFPFDDVDVILCNTGGDHSKMSNLYSNIPNKMHSAAEKLGCKLLIESTKDKLLKCKKIDDEEHDFGIHFYDECNRVTCLVEAFKSKDKNSFFELLNGSRKSSTELLKNMAVKDSYEGTPKEACDIVMNTVGTNGACKINGGGFAGSIVCFVEHKVSRKLIKILSKKYGKNNVKLIEIAREKPSCKPLYM